MKLVFTVYARAFRVLMQKPFRLWGLSLLYCLLSGAAAVLFSVPLGLSICIGMLLGTSMRAVYLHGYRGEQVCAEQLFECFKTWQSVKRVCAGLGWRFLWIFLWALIPLVGPIFAVIRGFEYWLTPYILLYEPEVPITEAIAISKQRTKGYKGSMFLATVLPPALAMLMQLILIALSNTRGIGGLFGFILVLFTLLFALLYPLFSGLVSAAFYEEIRSAAPDPTADPDPTAEA